MDDALVFVCLSQEGTTPHLGHHGQDLGLLLVSEDPVERLLVLGGPVQKQHSSVRQT